MNVLAELITSEINLKLVCVSDKIFFVLLFCFGSKLVLKQRAKEIRYKPFLIPFFIPLFCVHPLAVSVTQHRSLNREKC